MVFSRLSGGGGGGESGENITVLLFVQTASLCLLTACNRLSSTVHTPKTADAQETKDSQEVELSESR